MYNKKYYLDKIEEFNRHNPIYENMQGRTCYLAYLNVGERGWFLYEDNDWFGQPHRIHTSIIKGVEYGDEQIVVTTQNTRFIFKLIKSEALRG